MDTVIKVGSTESRWISRTVGLPGLPVEEEWLEPLGLLSLLVEALFVGLYLAVLVRPTATREYTVRRTGAEEGG